MPASVSNPARVKLEAGQLALGVGIRMTRSVEIAKAMAVSGFDWLFLDMEHGVMSLEACAQIFGRRIGCRHRPYRAGAERRIRHRHQGARQRRPRHRGAACRHRRRGEGGCQQAQISARGASLDRGHRAALRAALGGAGEAAEALNAANLTVVMLETPTAIANAEEIAAVPGIDVLLIGSNDLCAEMGIPGDFGNDRVAEAYRAMIAACRKHNKFPGMAGIYSEQIMPRYIDMGARFILSGQDAQFMLAGATSRTGFLRKTLPG